MRYGEISKTKDGCTFIVSYDIQTKTEGKNAKGEKVFLYKCYPKVTGNPTRNQEAVISSYKGILMAPAALLNMILKTK